MMQDISCCGYPCVLFLHVFFAHCCLVALIYQSYVNYIGYNIFLVKLIFCHHSSSFARLQHHPVYISKFSRRGICGFVPIVVLTSVVNNEIMSNLATVCVCIFVGIHLFCVVYLCSFLYICVCVCSCLFAVSVTL